MQCNYKLIIESPEHHYAKVRIGLKDFEVRKTFQLFMPAWSPGSYLMREYSRHIRWVKATGGNGEILHCTQVDLRHWQIDFDKSDLKQTPDQVSIEYEIYCHELTVRTSHIDTSHAFIHGPAVFMGVKDHTGPVQLAVDFPPLWSKITTGLKDISPSRQEFLYHADNYDELIDSPLELGCHETDGFRVEGKDHELAFYGETVLPLDFKPDMKKIVEHVSQTMGEIPYEKYSFITHLVPGLFGGLEHSNSTALQYCPRELETRKGYIRWLSLVAHEYFHTWNVKRIRPLELGPFDYTQEATTKMLWLAEGLTSFMDDWFVYRTGLCQLEEYLDVVKENLNRYLSIPGKKFHSLENSSFNAWIKLYRPEENSNNSSISYYLKGGIVFFVLHTLLVEKKRHTDELLGLLWKRYKANPQVGVDEQEVYAMVEELGGQEVREEFERMVSTTQDLDIEAALIRLGLKPQWKEGDRAWWGITHRNEGEQVYVTSVVLDSPAYKAGLNAGDEIIAINGQRLLNKDFSRAHEWLKIDKTYCLQVSRQGQMVEIALTLEKNPRSIVEIKVVDEKKVVQSLKANFS